MLMKNEQGVPCIIVENGVDTASCAYHKDTPKILAEGRLGTTFTLSNFNTEISRCFLVLNGGSNMSVIYMTAEFIEDRHKGIQRAYKVAFIAEDKMEDDYRIMVRSGITLAYNIANYSNIILLFVAIHIVCKKMAFQPREQSISFTSAKVDVKQGENNTQIQRDPHTPNKGAFNVGSQSNVQPTKTSKDDAGGQPFPLRLRLLLKMHGPVSVVRSERKIRELSSGSSTGRYCGKVSRLIYSAVKRQRSLYKLHFIIFYILRGRTN